MLEILSQNFFATVTTLAIVVLGCLQVWQYHRRTVKRLKASYDKVLDNMLDGFVVQKADGGIVGFNPAAYKILGLTEDELLRRSTVDPRWRVFREDGTPFPANEHPAMVTLATGQIQQNVILGVYGPDGEKRWLSVNSVPLFELDEANPSHVVATFQDITLSRRLAEEVRQAKQRLELALKASRIGIWEWNIAANELYFDDQLYAIYGQDKDAFMTTYENWKQVIHPDDRQRITTELAVALKSAQDVDTIFRIVRPDGSVRHLRGMGRVIQDAEQQATHMTGVTWDATDQAEREEHLQEAKELAEQASRAKSDFLANMSHEFRTPLNGIFGMIALLKDSSLSPSQLTMLHTMESCSKNLLAVLNDVLDFGNLEGRRMQIEAAPFDLYECAHDVVKLILPQANQKQLTLLFEYAEHVPRAVLADAARIKQVLLNLLNNAVKFTETGDIRFRVDGHNLDGSSFHFVISVQDTGIGISAVDQQRLFQAFSQADSSISRRFGGTGLGLAISSSLAVIMGGRLEVESEPGRGSTFRLQLRLDLPKPGSTDVSDETPSFDPQSMDPETKILVVEDNKINQIVITSLLGKLGYLQVDVVDDGLMALQQLELKRYDLVFMDMQMPGMDGITATRRIRERSKDRHLIIIAMTASAFEEDRRKCLEAGMNEFLAKPFNRNDLERILRLISQRRAS